MRASRDLAKKQEPRPRHVPCGSRRAACGMRAPAGAKKVRSWEFSSSAKSYAYNVVEYDKFFGVDEVDVKHGDRSGRTLCVSADFLLFKSLSEVQQTDDRTVQYSPDAQATRCNLQLDVTCVGFRVCNLNFQIQNNQKNTTFSYFPGFFTQRNSVQILPSQGCDYGIQIQNNKKNTNFS